VYQLDTQASLPAIPHVTASSLRCRHIGSDEGCSPAPASPAANSSPSSAQPRHLRLVVGPPVRAGSITSSSKGSPRRQRPAGWDSPSAGTRPQLSSALFEAAKQQVLLPASLVRQYGYYPMVLVQLPMYNEEAHCEAVIERACNMVWPLHRVIIQVCGMNSDVLLGSCGSMWSSCMVLGRQCEVQVSSGVRRSASPWTVSRRKQCLRGRVHC
jgi:hypothetical protein